MGVAPAVKLIPLMAVLLHRIHQLQITVRGCIGAAIDLISEMQIALVTIVDVTQRIPAEGAVRITEIQHHDLVAVLLQHAAVKHKELALRVRHDHGGARRRVTQNLDHRVNEGGCLTTTGGTDDETVHRRRKIDLHFLFLIVVNGPYRYTVGLLCAELRELIRLKQLVTILVGHKVGIFQCALDAPRLLPHHAAGTPSGIIVIDDPQHGDHAHAEHSEEIGLRIQKQPRIK